MKNIFKLVTILILLSFFIFSCHKTSYENSISEVTNQELLSLLPEDKSITPHNGEFVNTPEKVKEVMTIVGTDFSKLICKGINNLIETDNSFKSKAERIVQTIESASEKAYETGKFNLSLDLKNKRYGTPEKTSLKVNNLLLESYAKEKEENGKLYIKTNTNLELSVNGSEYNEKNFVKSTITRLSLSGESNISSAFYLTEGNINVNLSSGILFDTGKTNGIIKINGSIIVDDLQKINKTFEELSSEIYNLSQTSDTQNDLSEKIGKIMDKFPIVINFEVEFTDINGSNNFTYISLTRPSEFLNYKDFFSLLFNK